MKMKRKFFDGSFLFILLILGLSMSSCENETKDTPGPDGESKSYIPASNAKYEYTVTEDGENIATATKWINGSRDSSGLKLYNLHTINNIAGESMTMDNELYVANGKTYTRITAPEAWYMVIEELKKSPDIIVEEARLNGFPASMVMENALREGSKLTWEVPETMGQYIRFKAKDSGDKILEITQKLVHHPGEAENIESITVPAGTFSCTKFVYKISQEQIVKVDGQTVNTVSGTETITLWMAHGIGVVKEEDITVFDGSTSSTITVLNKIQ